LSKSSDALRGRGSELQWLREHLLAAEDGRGGLVLVSGEAGIGKSALARGVTVEAEQRDFRVLSGRAWSGALSRPTS